MISKRKRTINDLLELLIFWDVAEQAICLEHKITPQELKALMTFFYIQQTTNEFVSVDYFTKIFTQHHAQLIGSLERSEFLQRIKDKVNVTMKGEYIVRGCSRILNERINNKNLSKWRRLGISDERMEFLRPAAVKDAKLY